MAIYTDYHDLIDPRKHGFQSKPVWAYAFQEHFDSNLSIRPELHQTPIRGAIVKMHITAHFIPFKKNSTELCDSRKVNANSRCYADTEEEAWDGYAAAIANALEQHDERKKFLRSYFVEMPAFWSALLIIDAYGKKRFATGFTTEPHMYAQEIPNPKIPDVLMFPDTILPNAIPSDSVCWLSQAHGMTEEINPPVKAPDNPQFCIVGYDKDNDIYDDLYLAETEAEADFVMTQWTNRQKTDNLFPFRSSFGDPYDWFEKKILRPYRGV